MPAIMITGSHIPEDRNGLKFYLPSGEISKADEAGIVAALGTAPGEARQTSVRDEAGAPWTFIGCATRNCCQPMRWRDCGVGVYEHSSVARDILAELLEIAGATVVRLGRRDTFVAVDTEAFSDEVFAP